MYVAVGGPRRLGREHGEQARRQIQGFLEHLRSTLSLSKAQLEYRSLRFLPLFDRHCDRLVEEIRGLAEGANVGFAEALGLQFHDGLSFADRPGTAGAEGSTTFAVGPKASVDRRTRIGWTSHLPAELDSFGYVLKLKPTNQPAALIWTFGGLLGCQGFNELGTAQFSSGLWGGPGWKLGVAHSALNRLILEARSLDEALESFRTVPICSNGHCMTADGAGRLLDVECSTDGFESIGPTASHDFLVHANHYLLGRHAAPGSHRDVPEDSFDRQERWSRRMTEKAGAIDLALLQGWACDDGRPRIAALIAEPCLGTLHVHQGNPSERKYVAYEL
ncbi:MAG: C45 family autoproteolytic acyltransferase/hydrolase [Planctomycetia bacterium]